MYYVYMLTNWNNRVLYTGITNNLERRLYEHKNGLVDGFTKKYNVKKFVYFASTPDVKSAIEQEKRIRAGREKRKMRWLKLLIPLGMTYPLSGETRILRCAQNDTSA